MSLVSSQAAARHLFSFYGSFAITAKISSCIENSTCTCVCVSVHACVFLRMRAYVPACVFLRMCTHVRVFAHACIRASL